MTDEDTSPYQSDDNCITVKQLFDCVSEAVKTDPDAKVYFDSCAMKFGCHMVRIKSVILEPKESSPYDEAFLALHYNGEDVERE